MEFYAEIAETTNNGANREIGVPTGRRLALCLAGDSESIV